MNKCRMSFWLLSLFCAQFLSLQAISPVVVGQQCLPMERLEGSLPICIYNIGEGENLFFQAGYTKSLSSLEGEPVEFFWKRAFAMALLEKRLQKCAEGYRADWLQEDQTSLTPLPGILVVPVDKAMDLVPFFFFELGEIETKGFSEKEFQAVKMHFIDQLQRGQDQVGVQILSDLTFEAFCAFQKEFFQEEHRWMRVGVPEVVQEIWTLQSFENLRTSIEQERSIDKPEPQPPSHREFAHTKKERFTSGSAAMLVNAESFYHLPLSEGEKKDIHYIVSTIANKSIWALPFKKGELEKKGRRIEHVHPLRFIGYIVADHHLNKCLREIRKSSFKWDHFIGGFTRKMKDENRHNNIKKYVPGFCEQVHLTQNEVMGFIDGHNWEGLVRFLIR